MIYFDDVQARCPTPLTVVNSAGDKVAVEDPSESCVVLSPEVLTPSLGSDPSYVGSSANIFKRKADEDCKKPPTVPKLKMKNVKVEKKQLYQYEIITSVVCFF